MRLLVKYIRGSVMRGRVGVIRHFPVLQIPVAHVTVQRAHVLISSYTFDDRPDLHFWLQIYAMLREAVQNVEFLLARDGSEPNENSVYATTHCSSVVFKPA